WKEPRITSRCAANTACRDTGRAADSTTRSNRALNAASRSPVIAWSEPTAPGGRLICPSVRERSKNFPSRRGALQSLRSLAQSQTQAACRLSGSISLGFHICQPQEKTEPSPTSLATCFTESVSHLTTWYQAEAGSRPLRLPTPLWLRKLSMTPTRLAGIPSEVRSEIAFR